MPNTVPKLLIGTNNVGKIKELRVLLSMIPYVVTDPIVENILLEVDESGNNLTDNAVIKAVAFASTSGLLAISDDSGLEVDCLNGAPGHLSARYAGPNASDADKVNYLLGKLEGVEWPMRTARFRSVIALAEPQGSFRVFEGQCEGMIALEPGGYGGFGYDPIFYVSALGKLMSELTIDEKNMISHRGNAVRKAIEYLSYQQ